jgi:hypothetical protein
MNDTNEGNTTKQYLDAILIPSGVLVDTSIHQPAKTCTSSHKCIFGMTKSIMDEISTGLLAGNSSSEALTCDINAIDALGHFMNVRKTHYVDFPDIFIDTNNSFCGFTTCEGLDGTVTGNIYPLSSIQNPIPFSCKIIVFNKTTPTSDFKIYFADKIADINYKSTEERYGMDGLNCYSGKVDVSDWGEGLFSNMKTKVTHNIFGTFNLYTTSLIITKVTKTNPETPTIEGGQAQFEQGLRGVANNMGNFLMFMMFGFFTNPIGFFMAYFIVFIVLIFLWLSFRGR